MEYDSLHTYYIGIEEVRHFEMVAPQLDALRKEFGELKSKKPDAIVSKTKIKLVNAVLSDALELLGDLPESKYLSIVDDEDVPQVSDIALILSQFQAAMTRFKNLHTRDYRWFMTDNEKKPTK